MRYFTSLRKPTIKTVEEIEYADIVLGIPCYNSEKTVGNVIEKAGLGLVKFFKSTRSVIIVADGGSTDDTREEAEKAHTPPFVEKTINIYRGIPGKGTAIRAIFECAKFLDAKLIILLDADLKSITPQWIYNLGQPIIEGKAQFVAPYYLRYKYDATITNTIAYLLTRSLYGKQLRQPIGGDFAFSNDLVSFLVQQSVWDTDIARFGVDIWLTTESIVQKFKIAQAYLGTKVHGKKDPQADLGPMFRQVVSTLFFLMERHENFWINIKGSERVPVLGKEIKSNNSSQVGDIKPNHIPKIRVNPKRLYENFRIGFNDFESLWKRHLQPENFQFIKRFYKQENPDFSFPAEVWAKIVYDICIAFHKLKRNKIKLINTFIPLYYCRIASLVEATDKMDIVEFEDYIEQNAIAFEREKDYLIHHWKTLKK